jgi:hypothetical protein
VATVLLLLATPAVAQDISDADKIAALKRGHELNDRQSTRWGSIDLTQPVRTIPIDNIPKVIQQPPAPAPTKVASVVQPERNICTRHKLRKVITGKSWRCRK